MVVLLLRTLMLLLKSDDDENETNADVLKRPCMCVLFLSLSRVMRGLYDRATRKSEEGERKRVRKSPKYKSVSRTNTNVHSRLLCRGCLSSLSLSLLIEKCRIETTKASRGGEQRKEYRRHHIVLLLLISHRPLRHLRDNKT